MKGKRINSLHAYIEHQNTVLREERFRVFDDAPILDKQVEFFSELRDSHEITGGGPKDASIRDLLDYYVNTHTLEFLGKRTAKDDNASGDGNSCDHSECSSSDGSEDAPPEHLTPAFSLNTPTSPRRTTRDRREEGPHPYRVGVTLGLGEKKDLLRGSKISLQPGVSTVIELHQNNSVLISGEVQVFVYEVTRQASVCAKDGHINVTIADSAKNVAPNTPLQVPEGKTAWFQLDAKRSAEVAAAGRTFVQLSDAHGDVFLENVSHDVLPENTNAEGHQTSEAPFLGGFAVHEKIPLRVAGFSLSD